MMAETETVLLRRFAGNGDAEAFAEIIRRHAGLVYGAALRVLADVDRASDVAQETFLQLTKEAGSVTDSLPGWLHRVATRKAIDLMRRDTSRRYREIRHAKENPRETAEWRDISPYVDAELASLLPELRDVLVSHFLQGRTTREIAAARGISQATVSRRLNAGVKLLRGRLRRRGIIVAAGILALLLGEEAVEAAPAALMAELGKMAIVGGAAAISTGGMTSTFSTVAASLAATVNTKAAVIAAVAVIGVGSVVTHRFVAKPRGSRQVAAMPAAYSPYSSLAGLGPIEMARSQPGPDWNAFLGLTVGGTPDTSTYRRPAVSGPGEPCETPEKKTDGAESAEALTRREAPQPDGSEPNDTDPNDTDPNDTDPNDTDPNDTDPNDTDPNDTDPNDTDPNDTDPNDTGS